MTARRLSSLTREKQLRLAIGRIERGRAHSRESKLTIAAVAREADVSTALIHNHYPEIAEYIRVKQGRSSRAQRDAKHDELKSEREKNRQLRSAVDALEAQVRKLASINETLLIEVRELKAKQAGSNHVATIPRRPSA